ncbi:hypothetical protein BR93DRAFT_13883 [Coniochaeta sp. PMI_546]|nr:hypothetical protein BR93DRAFT_13883 [Coniochaeta sp. PMI_546]
MSSAMEQRSYSPVSFHESKTSLECENAQLIGISTAPKARRERLRTVWMSICAAVFLSGYTAFVVLLARRTVVEDPTHGGKIIKSLAADYVQHEIREIDYLDWDQSSAFFGKPSKTVDSNWHELIKYHNIGLPASYMRELGREYQGVQFPDGRYFGSLMVYHHLHCLKHIYHALYPEYYPDARPEAGHEDDFQKHTEHCLGALKAYVMCKADVTIETMLWSPKHSLPLHNVTSTHQCVKWDSILDYAKANNEDVFADGMLVHPSYGPVFKDRKPVNIF